MTVFIDVQRLQKNRVFKVIQHKRTEICICCTPDATEGDIHDGVTTLGCLPIGP